MLDILRKLRSIRKYQDKDIETKTIEILKEAALRAPSSRDIKPWRFIFVTESALLEKLSRAKDSGSSFSLLYAPRRRSPMSGLRTAPSPL